MARRCPGAFAVAAALVVRAWRRELPWAWFVLVVVVALQLLAYGGPLLVGKFSAAGWIGTVLFVALLVLLLHPDSRAVIASRHEPARPPSWRAPS